MNFSVRLDAEQVSVDPGDKALLSIEVTNSGPETDQYEISVEGLDPEWTAIMVPSFSVPAGAKSGESIIFQPPRANESVAAGYPFTVKVRSLESGEQRTLAAVLQVRPFNHLSMELQPKKGTISPMIRENSFQATIMNLGNAEQTLQLFGSDPDEELAYAFEPEHISIGPGHQKEIEVTATPTHSRPFGGARLYGFTISARNPDMPNTSCAAQAQLEQRPLVTAGSLAIFIGFVILVIGWLQFAPKPPVVDIFNIADADRASLQEGQVYRLTWQTSNAKSVQITFNKEEVVSAGQPDGSQTFTATQSGTFRIFAVRDNRQSDSRSLAVTVTEIPFKAPAVISEFKVDNRTVEPGEQIMVNYRVEGAKEVVLRPVQRVLSATERSVSITAPEEEGTVIYQLVARNGRGNETLSDPIRITVRKQPKAAIISFGADPATIDSVIAKTTVTWEVKRASRIEIRCDGKTYTSTDATGTMEIDVFKSGDCELVAYDENDIPVRKSVKLTVKTSEPPADDKTGTTGTTGTPPTTGSTGTPPIVTTGGGR